MTGGGQVTNTSGTRASFGGNARGTPGDLCLLPSGCGHFNYNSPSLHLNGPVTRILLVDPDRQEMTFCFQDTTGLYTVRWRDVKEPGRNADTIGIWTSCSVQPLVAEVTDRTISVGNIQWHRQ
jgi:hypothetical protein